ncbi:hypothetical protein [Dyadobacter sp. Leaf189]|uniref:hypothetical protein n=1 Tax=Dyadobacter sp. Leaf189 TaxID=1736295 RepID=UPI0006FF7E00|nr:hypothetical protein [Dyadobacter sp. Leaf189]KQS28024.1 hypothetical protein ASG33_16680 [Dyadobacter sp. Leaf189]
MVEVFKTNISKQSQANLITASIERTLPDHRASFDLEDCDKVLRIKCDGEICAERILKLIKDLGYEAEVLTDELNYFPSMMELGFQPFETSES